MSENSDLILKKLDRIEQAVAEIAVQDEKIINLQSQIAALWKKNDARVDEISAMKTFHAACPAQAIKDSQRKLWFALGMMGTMMTGGLLKAMGVF